MDNAQPPAKPGVANGSHFLHRGKRRPPLNQERASTMVASMGQYANRVGGDGREVVFSARSAYRVMRQRDVLIQPEGDLGTIH